MISSQYIPKVEFDSIFSRVPRLTVEVIIDSPHGIILSKRAIEPCIGQWHIPGGTVRFNESLEDAVKRVAKDELDVEVEVKKLLGYIEYPEILKTGYKGWPVGIAFKATILRGNPSGGIQGEEIGYFKQTPENTIIEQAKFLDKKVFI